MVIPPGRDANENPLTVSIPVSLRGGARSGHNCAAAMLPRAIVLTACWLLFSCGGKPPRPAARPVAGDEVSVKRDSGRHEVHYEVSAGDCRIRWTLFESETNRGVVRHVSDCALALPEQAPLIAKLLAKAVGNAGAEGIRTISWGRLEPDGARDHTLARRLALAARLSSGWNAAKGMPRGGDINGWVRKLANDTAIYDELRPVFQARGLEIRLAGVEKVLVLPAGRLPFFEELRKQGVRESEKVPFDCQAWFSVRPAAGSSL
jgi:hypothetical protein